MAADFAAPEDELAHEGRKAAWLKSIVGGFWSQERLGCDSSPRNKENCGFTCPMLWAPLPEVVPSLFQDWQGKPGDLDRLRNQEQQ